MASTPTLGNAETRDRILTTAGRLFAEQGYDATSIRDITTHADCNVAAVNYHFGGKDKLYVETFRRLLVDLRDRRINRLRLDMRDIEEPTLEDFLLSFAESFLEPLVDGQKGHLFLSFFAREMVDSHLPVEMFVSEFIKPLLDATAETLERLGPPLDTTTTRLCLMSVVGQLLHTLKAWHHFARPDGPALVPQDLDVHIRHIVRFSAGGIRACSPSPEAS